LEGVPDRGSLKKKKKKKFRFFTSFLIKRGENGRFQPKDPSTAGGRNKKRGCPLPESSLDISLPGGKKESHFGRFKGLGCEEGEERDVDLAPLSSFGGETGKNQERYQRLARPGGKTSPRHCHTFLQDWEKGGEKEREVIDRRDKGDANPGRMKRRGEGKGGVGRSFSFYFSSFG